MAETQYRIRRTIARQGETFMVGAVSHTGIVTMMSPGAARRYLTDAVVDLGTRPIYAIYVADDDTTVVTDTITYDGLTLPVLRIIRRRLRGELVYKVIFARE